MAKRFGRNQKRKMREELASADRVLHAAKASYHELWNEFEDLRRKAVIVNVAFLQDNSRGDYEAKMEAHMMGYEGLHLLQRIDARQLAMEREKDSFVRHVSNIMATEMMRGIGHRWN